MTGPNDSPKTPQSHVGCSVQALGEQQRENQGKPNTPRAISLHTAPAPTQNSLFSHSLKKQQRFYCLELQDGKLPPCPKKLRLGLQTLHLFSSEDGQNISGYSETGIKSLGTEHGKIRVKPNLCQSCTSKRLFNP